LKRIAIFAVLIFVASVGIGILYFLKSQRQSETTSIHIPDKYLGLYERVENYYRLEREKKWDETWSFRVPLYQQTVPKDTYVRQMVHDTAGWELKSHVVRHLSEDGPCVLLQVTFVESPPKGYFSLVGSIPDVSEITSTDSSLWERIDGIWSAWETGSRMHLPLNRGLVAPNQSLQGDPATCGGRPPELKR